MSICIPKKINGSDSKAQNRVGSPWMTAFRPFPQCVPDQVVHFPESPLGGAVPVIVGPAPNLWVQTAYDLHCWTLPVLLQIGFNGAVMPIHLCLLGLRQQCPFVPLDLESQEVKPFGTMHNPGFGFTELQPPPPQKSCQCGENMLFEHLPRRGDDHKIVRVSDETDAFVLSRFAGWTLWIAPRIFTVEEAFHAIQGNVRQQG